jgi:hypothetical protein
MSEPTYIDLYSTASFSEYEPFLQIIVDGKELDDSYRSRIVETKITLTRVKRPKASIVFIFDSLKTLKGNNSADVIPDAMPLGSYVQLRYGFTQAFKDFGTFDVAAFDYDFRDGGVTVRVLLESFLTAKQTMGFKTFTSGNPLDVVMQLVERAGINLEIDGTSFTQSWQSVYDDMDMLADIANQDREKDPNRDYTSENATIQDAINASEDDPFVQVGESDVAFLYEYLAAIGLSIIEEDNKYKFVPLFTQDDKARLKLIYGGVQSNMSTLSFRAKSPSVSYIRTPTKHIAIQENVPLQGGITSATDETVIRRPVKPNPNDFLNDQGSMGPFNERQYQNALEAYNAKFKAFNESKSKNTANQSSQDTAQTAKSKTSSTTTRKDSKKRKLGKIIGAKRSQGRVLSAQCKLLAGSTIPYPSQGVTLDCSSNYFNGTYSIDQVDHVISPDSGFETSISMIRGLPKKLLKANRNKSKNTENNKSNTAQATHNATQPQVQAPRPKIMTQEQFYNEKRYNEGPAAQSQYEAYRQKQIQAQQKYDTQLNREGKATKDTGVKTDTNGDITL